MTGLVITITVVVLYMTGFSNSTQGVWHWLICHVHLFCTTVARLNMVCSQKIHRWLAVCCCQTSYDQTDSELQHGGAQFQVYRKPLVQSNQKATTERCLAFAGQHKYSVTVFVTSQILCISLSPQTLGLIPSKLCTSNAGSAWEQRGIPGPPFAGYLLLSAQLVVEADNC